MQHFVVQGVLKQLREITRDGFPTRFKCVKRTSLVMMLYISVEIRWKELRIWMKEKHQDERREARLGGKSRRTFMKALRTSAQ